MTMVERNIQIPADDDDSNSRSVKLIFDAYSPRSHFIIIQRDVDRKMEASDSEIEQIMSLVGDFLSRKPQYEHNAILSFHRGKWYQRHFKYFHAHLCVPERPYCQEAKRKITFETSQQRWESATAYLNQLQKDRRTARYEYARYRDDCISKAHECLNDPVSYCVPLSHFESSHFSLVFLAASPRIGIFAKTRQTDLKSLYNFMIDFYRRAAKRLSAINRRYNNFGAHLCLFVRGNKFNSNLTQRHDRVLIDAYRTKSMRLVGYIQIDEQLYLRWLPAKYHEIWLNQFKQVPHLVLT